MAPDKKDIELINSMMEQHNVVMGVVNRRLSSIKVILKWWSSGNINSAINALSMMGDTSVVMDVLNYTFADNQRVGMLNYENVTQVLSHASALCGSKYETHVLCGMKTVAHLLSYFSKGITDLKTTPVGRGVDLAREERVRKVDLCIEQFSKIF